VESSRLDGGLVVRSAYHLIADALILRDDHFHEFLVALGVDYNIFLVTRAKEESEKLGLKEGMIKALASTGGVITSAGILLAAVFAVLGVLPLIALYQIGIIVGIGVLLDTLLVRTVIVPSLAFITGKYFWWPNHKKAKA
jgi:RND superfamily putative drug exporter